MKLLKLSLLIPSMVFFLSPGAAFILNDALLDRITRELFGMYEKYKAIGLEHFISKTVELSWLRRYQYLDVIQYFEKKWFETVHDEERDRPLAKKYNKNQEEFSKETPFPCNVTGWRSKERPKSVDNVRPGDIDVIAQIGDSILRGNGLAGANVFQFASADHDIAMAIGGRETWRQYLTLPNIFKEFNPSLTGYATAPNHYHGRYVQHVNDFANPGWSIADFPFAAKQMVKKMKADPKINFEEDWKLVTVLAGGLSMCHYYCYFKDPSVGIARDQKRLEETLDYLFENSPRTIVNFIVVPNFIKLVSGVKGASPLCKAIQLGICPCYYIIKYNKKEEYRDAMNQVPPSQIEVASQPKYQTKEDFTVLIQPFFLNASLPTRETARGTFTDFRYLSTDCLHFSQRVHAAAAQEAWNALLSPPNEKNDFVSNELLQNFRCPTERRPYIITPRNEKLYM